MTGEAFDKCAKNFKTYRESFQALQNAIPQSSKSVENYQTDTQLKLKALSTCFLPYWKRLTLPFPGTEKYTSQGFLWKKTSRMGGKKWKRLYFVLENHRLRFCRKGCAYPAEGDEIILLLTSVKPIETHERRFCIQLYSQSSSTTLAALTEWDRDEWIAVIQNNIQYLLDHSEEDVTLSKAKTQNSNPNLRASSNNSEKSSAHASNDSQHSKEAELKKDIFKHSCTCADCGSPNPMWCCINWGTTICLNCAGIHRSLSTSSSKVRSLSLDKLDPGILLIIKEVGNKMANEILEECVGEDKIGLTISKQQRELFIRKKYLDKGFVKALSTRIDVKEAIKANDVKTILKSIINGLIQTEHLMLASSFGNTVIAGLVILNVPDPNVLDSGGWNSLSYAAYHGNKSAVKVLLAGGVDPNSSEAAHPYLVAKSRGNDELSILFYPYWKGESSSVATNLVFTPPLNF